MSTFARHQNEIVQAIDFVPMFDNGGVFVQSSGYDVMYFDYIVQTKTVLHFAQCVHDATNPKKTESIVWINFSDQQFGSISKRVLLDLAFPKKFSDTHGRGLGTRNCSSDVRVDHGTATDNRTNVESNETFQSAGDM